MEIAYRLPIVRPVSLTRCTLSRLTYGATVPSSITGTATSTRTAASDPANPPTLREPSALTDSRRNGSATNGTSARSSDATRTTAHSPRRSARRSASLPPSQYPADSATRTVAIVLAQMIVEAPK